MERPCGDAERKGPAEKCLNKKWTSNSSWNALETNKRPKKKPGLAVGAVADHVDMGMMSLVVEGGVPAELAQRYLHGLRKLRRVTGEQVFPVGGVVVAQAGGVLPAQ